ncbi:hypothetical protein M758_6G063500 [Ceratodon purpureus]|uniref:Uncharacterized protein n=1 Tax=Ceratodon purpureus TaxID=3225 RepID=A0A8T0HGE3_CERPU|nr:hypothetical protein KC19_6G067600 [Ceratodon purpureus]KAG0612932.1 hypothetical protein M758_6G063500 [Ceratodon purpureus]
MVRSRLSASVESPNLDVIVDLGHPLLNTSVDGFLKVGGVGAAHAAVQDTFRILRSEQLSKNDLEKLVKRAGYEGLQWGAVAGVYAGVEYSLEKARAKQDWKNAAIGGAVTGALLSIGDGSFSRDKMFQHAITGGAIATASEFIRNLI